MAVADIFSLFVLSTLAANNEDGCVDDDDEVEFISPLLFFDSLDAGVGWLTNCKSAALTLPTISSGSIIFGG